MWSPEISPTRESKKETQKHFLAKLTLPDRRNEGNPDKDLAEDMWKFLADKGFINKVDMWRGSWGCKYENGTIYINEHPMPREQYEYYIFRLGKDSSTGRQLFPKEGNEADMYRYLHEASHGYQEYIKSKECPNNPEMWYTKAIGDEIESYSSLLFDFCYNKRRENPERGLSTFGNVSNYNSITDPDSQRATRANEDVNEFITMYLWNPQYLDTYLEYLSGNISGYGDLNLREGRLIKLSNREKELLKIIINKIIMEMKENISKERL